MFNNKKVSSNGRIEEQKRQLHKTNSKMANVIIPYQ